MLNIHQLSDAISHVKPENESIEQFERWLRRESRNVHSWGEEAVVDAVLAVESVLSSYRFDSMQPDEVKKELENAVRPFDSPYSVLDPSRDFAELLRLRMLGHRLIGEPKNDGSYIMFVQRKPPSSVTSANSSRIVEATM